MFYVINFCMILPLSPNFAKYFSLFFMCGSPIGPFVLQLNIAFFSKFFSKICFPNSYSNLESKIPFRIFTQIQVWSFFSELLVVFDVSFPISYSCENSETKFWIWIWIRTCKSNHNHKKRKGSLETPTELAVQRNYVKNQAILEPILLYRTLKCKQIKEQGSENCLCTHVLPFYKTIVSFSFFCQDANKARSNRAIIGYNLSKKHKKTLYKTQSGDPNYVNYYRFEIATW